MWRVWEVGRGGSAVVDTSYTTASPANVACNGAFGPEPASVTCIRGSNAPGSLGRAGVPSTLSALTGYLSSEFSSECIRNLTN